MIDKNEKEILSKIAFRLKDNELIRWCIKRNVFKEEELEIISNNKKMHSLILESNCNITEKIKNNIVDGLIIKNIKELICRGQVNKHDLLCKIDRNSNKNLIKFYICNFSKTKKDSQDIFEKIGEDLCLCYISNFESLSLDIILAYLKKNKCTSYYVRGKAIQLFESFLKNVDDENDIIDLYHALNGMSAYSEMLLLKHKSVGAKALNVFLTSKFASVRAAVVKHKKATTEIIKSLRGDSSINVNKAMCVSPLSDKEVLWELSNNLKLHKRLQANENLPEEIDTRIEDYMVISEIMD